MLKQSFRVSVLLLSMAYLYAQESTDPAAKASPSAPEDTATPNSTNAPANPDSATNPDASTNANENAAAKQNPDAFNFKGFYLGMSADEIKSHADNDPNIQIDQSRYLDLMNNINSRTVKILFADGKDLIQQFFIDIHEDQAFQITLSLSTNDFDFYTLQDTLRERYGEPTVARPRLIRWSTDTVDLTLEYPCTIRVLQTETAKQVWQQEEAPENDTRADSQVILEEI